MNKLCGCLLALALLLSACGGPAAGPSEPAGPALQEPTAQPAEKQTEADAPSGTAGEENPPPPPEEEEIPADPEIKPAEESVPGAITEQAAVYGTDFDSTWGDLLAAAGGRLPWDTLSPEQRALVHYPRFDVALVYWTEGGKSYHAVDWCYTLSNSPALCSGTLEQAQSAGKTDPCSKCVGD